MRNIVEHGQISGSSDDDRLVRACSCARRCTRWISVPTPMTEPGRRAARPHSRMQLGRADLVGELARRRARTRGARSRCRRGARRGTRRRARAGSAGAPSSGPSTAGTSPPCTSRSLEAAEVVARVPHPHVVVAVAHRRSRCCGRGAGRGRTAPVVARWPRAHSSTARALDDVQTAPPCSADERLERGRRVHVGDRHDPVDVGDVGRAPPTPPRPGRCRPCRPSSSRR